MDINPENDGIDHINIYSKGMTNLGRDLTNFSPIGFKHPEYGKFNSVEGFWYWLSCNDHPRRDDLKVKYGYKAKQLGKEILNLVGRRSVGSYTDKILNAITYKILQNNDLLEALKESVLPLQHYYVYGTAPNFKVVTPGYEFITDHISFVRDNLQNEPIVVNKYKEPFDEYIGRGSKWGNPFPITDTDTRELVIAKYKKYLWEQVNSSCGKITVDDILSLRGKRLGCFCKPKPCHGDVIVAAYRYFSNIK